MQTEYSKGMIIRNLPIRPATDAVTDAGKVRLGGASRNLPIRPATDDNSV